MRWVSDCYAFFRFLLFVFAASEKHRRPPQSLQANSARYSIQVQAGGKPACAFMVVLN